MGELARLSVRVQAKKKQVEAASSDLPGGVAPLGDFWDPLSLSASANEGQILYFREAELKHGRICMLATLGIYVGEKFHPLFGGDIDAFSVSNELFAAPALGPFWAAILVAAGGIEIFTSTGRGEGTQAQGFTPELTPGTIPGDFGFDPLGLQKNLDDREFTLRRNQELLHGRLAMISAAGMIAQELLTQKSLSGAEGDKPLLSSKRKGKIPCITVSQRSV